MRTHSRHVKLSRVTIVVLAVIVLVLGLRVLKESIERKHVRSQITQLNDEIANNQERQAQLQALLDFSQSPDFFDEEARTKFNLKKPGEQVALVELPAQEASTSTPDAAQGALANLGHWWMYFFGSRQAAAFEMPST